jgi:hypothetical protein
MVTRRFDVSWRFDVTRKFYRIAPARFLAGGCAALVGIGVLIELAQAQYVPPPKPLPPPVFNPSSPYTVPQPNYRPLAPATPSAGPGYVVTSPSEGRLARTAVHSHRRTSVTKTRAKTSVAKTRLAKAHWVHRGRSVVVGPAPRSYSYYYAPFGYGYGCAWRRAWDGYWFRTSPCS